MKSNKTNVFAIIAFVLALIPFMDVFSIIVGIVALSRVKEYNSGKKLSFYALVISFAKILIISLTFILASIVESVADNSFYCDIVDSSDCSYVNGERVCQYSNVFGIDKKLNCTEEIKSEYNLYYGRGAYRDDVNEYPYNYTIDYSSSDCYGDGYIIELNFRDDTYRYFVESTEDLKYYSGDSFIIGEDGMLKLTFVNRYVEIIPFNYLCKKDSLNDPGELIIYVD